MFPVVTVTSALATLGHLQQRQPELRICIVRDLRDWRWILHGTTLYIDGEHGELADTIYDAAMHLLIANTDNVIPLIAPAAS